MGRSADAVTLLESRVKDEERNVEARGCAGVGTGPNCRASQSPSRRRAPPRGTGPEASAAGIDKALRHRYERLRRTRSGDVVVPLRGGACGGCHTSVTLNRRSQIRAGLVLEGCEACGAILYPAEPDGSA